MNAEDLGNSKILNLLSVRVIHVYKQTKRCVQLQTMLNELNKMASSRIEMYLHLTYTLIIFLIIIDIKS